jgi:hypothetical protein
MFSVEFGGWTAGESLALRPAQMPSQREPSLRLVKGVAEDRLETEQTLVDVQLAAAAGEASPALDEPILAPVSGEIKNRRMDANATLTGVGAFAALKSAANERTRQKHNSHHKLHSAMFVTPATVAAIANAKRNARRSEQHPSVEVDLEQIHAPKIVPRPTDKIRIVKETDIPGTTSKKWEQFEDLGLAPRPITKKAQKLVVSTYRLLGFSILTLIVVVLLGYIGTTAFYFLNHSWVTPVALSANDEKVVALQGQLATQENERERLVHELTQSERAIRAEQSFQLQFANAIKHDLQGRRAALARVEQLSHAAASTRAEIRATNGDYSQSTVNKMGDDYQAGLIDRQDMLAGKYQLAQISSANLSLAERQADFDQRAAELAAQTQSLDSLLAQKGGGALSYDVLKIARDYETSKLALARETDNRTRLATSIERQDTIINGIKQSAYLRAVANGAHVAMVPYDNLGNVEPGARLYACKLSMIVCRKVGEVIEVLPGEVTVKHPTREAMLRGRMIEMKLTDAGAAQDEVLFAGHKPLGF